jgi:hypothetical protein
MLQVKKQKGETDLYSKRRMMPLLVYYHKTNNEAPLFPWFFVSCTWDPWDRQHTTHSLTRSD